MKRYLFFVSLSYAYPIYIPLQIQMCDELQNVWFVNQ